MSSLFTSLFLILYFDFSYGARKLCREISLKGFGMPSKRWAYLPAWQIAIPNKVGHPEQRSEERDLLHIWLLNPLHSLIYYP